MNVESKGYDILRYYYLSPYSDYVPKHTRPNLSDLIISVLNGGISTLQSWLLTQSRDGMYEESVYIT